MKTTLKLFSILSVALALPTEASAQNPPNACASQPFCTESNDFVAVVTSFRIGTNNVYKQKIIDVAVRFQNRTDHQLILGYVDHSGVATDDHGNRSIPWGPNAYRGIGLVTGNSFEPKLILRSGSSGDAQFELVQQGTPQLTGAVYVLDLTIAQIQPGPGNQQTLAGEFPLHFQGLANGASGTSPALTSLTAAPASAADAISNLKSLFGKKKSAQNAAAITNSGANTVVAGGAAASSGAQSTMQTATSSGPSSAASSGKSPTSPQGNSRPESPEPIQNQQSRPSTNPGRADLQGAALADPGDPDPNLGTAKVAASAGKYDVLGIKLGMPAKDAMAILKTHGQFQVTPETIKYDFLPAPMTYGVMAANAVVVRNGGHAFPGSEKLYFVVTMPPNQPVISKVSRYLLFSKDTAPTADSLVADLSKKYGTPSYDSHPKDLYYAGYRELFWVDDAQGHRLLNQVMPNGGYSDQINNCRSVSTFSFPAANPADPNIQVDSVRIKQELEQGYTTQYSQMYGCANLTIIYAKIFYGYPIGVSSRDVAGGLLVVMGSAPIDHTAADATRDYLVQASKARDLAQKQKAQQNKPVL
jgi:hypothetical protein